MSDRKLVLAIDFDGVLHDPTNVEPGYKMGKPVPGALGALTVLRQQGHMLIVHTNRVAVDTMGAAYQAPDNSHVGRWLDYFGFPHMLVTAVKPNADVFLDDRAVRFYNWHHAMAAIEAEAK
jgi:hypothetical protein